MMRRIAILAALLVSCASAPRPRVMSDVDAVRGGSAAREAAKLSPQAHAHADQVRSRSEQAFRDGDRAGAQILGEHALSAYGHAFVLARLVKAEAQLRDFRHKLAAAEKDLSSLDEQHARIAAEADELELRVKVARDAVPLTPNAPGGPEREAARREAALSLASQARLLCMAARLLDPKLDGLAADLGKLDTLDQALAAKRDATPIDDAIAVRSSCLKRLTSARRPALRAAPAAGAADALLAELSQAGDLQPYRDERGVVVTIRGAFGAAEKLSAEADQRLALLGRIAKAHPDFPVLVVVHAPQGPATARDTRRAELVGEALRKAGAARVEPRATGGAQPVADQRRTGAATRNERIEIVFVSPS